MGRSKVIVEIKNGGIGGLIGTPDQVGGMILTGVAATGLALNTAKQINTLRDAVDLGIDEAYDTTNTCKAYDNIKKFYDEAGNGKELWIMLVSETESLTDICDYDGANARVKDLLEAASGRIRLLGVQRSPANGYTPTVTEGIDADVYTAITELQTTLETFEGDFKPAIGVLDGLAFDGTIGDLKDLTTLTDSKVSVLLSNTDDQTASNEFYSTAIGTVIGRLANIPVQQNIGRVKDGALKPANFYLETVDSSTLSNADMDTLADKGFLFARPHIGLSGFFFDGDPTATAVTDDYKFISRNRVMNKALELAYSVYVRELNDQVIVTDEGNLTAGAATYYETIISQQLGQQMENTGEISAFSVFVDPQQDIATTGQLVVEITIVPVGINREIKVTIGFSTSLNS